MNHSDHVDLLRQGVPPGPAEWADLGAGTGAFSLALAELLGPGAILHCVDVDQEALHTLQRKMSSRSPEVEVRPLRADFTRGLPLSALDGILMANSLHFVRNKTPIVRKLTALLKSGASFVLVEYNVDQGNEWVPYPISYSRWEALAADCGLRSTRLIGAKPSRFLREIYSAASVNRDS